MNCPHCQKELPEHYGKDLSTSEIGSSKPSSRTAKIYWPIFLAVLLAPTFLTMLSAILDRAVNQSVSLFIGLVGGGAAGIACGLMLGFRLGSTGLERIFVTLLLCLIMAVVAVTLSCFGCQAGGYRLSFH
jgi:hypothetical protein